MNSLNNIDNVVTVRTEYVKKMDHLPVDLLIAIVDFLNNRDRKLIINLYPKALAHYYRTLTWWDTSQRGWEKGYRLQGALPPHMLSHMTHIYLHRWCNAIIYKLPNKLRFLDLGTFFNRPLPFLPSTLQTLHLSCSFNQPIKHIRFPDNLRDLCFGKDFNQLLPEHLPLRLIRLRLGHSYNQSLNHVKFPPKLRLLSLGDSYNHPLPPLPQTLRSFSWGCSFNQPVEGLIWPPLIKVLHLGNAFNQPLHNTLLPTQLEDLSFGTKFNQPIHNISWPPHIHNIYFGLHFNQPLENLPKTLRYIHVPRSLRHVPLYFRISPLCIFCLLFLWLFQFFSFMKQKGYI